jgi:hypothetical protein
MEPLYIFHSPPLTRGTQCAPPLPERLYPNFTAKCLHIKDVPLRRAENLPCVSTKRPYSHIFELKITHICIRCVSTKWKPLCGNTSKMCYRFASTSALPLGGSPKGMEHIYDVQPLPLRGKEHIVDVQPFQGTHF